MDTGKTTHLRAQNLLFAAVLLVAAFALTACTPPSESAGGRTYTPKKLTERAAYRTAINEWAIIAEQEGGVGIIAFRSSALMKNVDAVMAALVLDSGQKRAKIEQDIKSEVGNLPPGGRYVLLNAADKKDLHQQVLYVYRDAGEARASVVADVIAKGQAPPASKGGIKAIDEEAISFSSGGGAVVIRSSNARMQEVLAELKAQGGTALAPSAVERQLDLATQLGHYTIANVDQIGKSKSVWWVYWDGTRWKARHIRPE